MRSTGETGVVKPELSRRELVIQFGDVYELSAPNRVNEALPAGYQAYTCMLHALIDNSGNRTRYSPTDQLSWDDVRDVQRELHKSAHTAVLASEGSLDAISGPVLVEILKIGGADRNYVMVDMPASMTSSRYAFDVTGVELADRLTDESLGPVLWFPTSLAWVCATPWDAWETYIASTTQLARVIRQNSDLETLACTWPDAP